VSAAVVSARHVAAAAAERAFQSCCGSTNRGTTRTSSCRIGSYSAVAVTTTAATGTTGTSDAAAAAPAAALGEERNRARRSECCVAASGSVAAYAAAANPTRPYWGSPLAHRVRFGCSEVGRTERSLCVCAAASTAAAFTILNGGSVPAAATAAPTAP
jgi:hypothetical protein